MSADSSETPTPEESGARTPDDAAPGSAPAPQPHSETAGHWIPPSLEHLQGLLPNYEFLEILGHGGMGAVYKARQLSLDRLVAIKILPPGIANPGDHSFVERFKNEARTMAKMNHPGIVNVYDFGQTTEGQLYLVMEYIDGTDVAKMVRSQGRLPQEYALAIAAHVCDALQYAHTHGVIHRDIKPANVLINMEGQVKVADFGLAKAKTRGAQSTALTDTNITMGTPDYVAPEALVMGMEPDHRADLYALGVMLYNMLTGEIPRGRFKPVSEKTGGDPRFDIIINKAMQERDARYQTALNMRRDLDVILTVPLAKSDATSSTIPKQFAQQNAVRKPVARRPSAPHTPPPAPPPKKSGAPVGIIVLVLLAVGGFFGWKQFRKPSPTAADSSATTIESTHPASPAPNPSPVPASIPQPKAPAALVDEAGFTPLFGADGIRDWHQNGSAKWDYSGGALSCKKSDKSTARLRCPKDLVSADFEIRFAVRGDRGPGFEFRGNAGEMADSYVFDPTALRTGGSIFWDGKRNGVFAKPGQRVRITHDDQRDELSKLTALPKWKDGDWNEVILTVQGNHFTCACNGLIAAELIDESPSYRAGPGEFGFRVTNNTDGELSAQYKDMRIRRLSSASSTPSAGITSYPQPPAWNDATALLRANILSNGALVTDGEWISISRKVQMPNLAPGKTFRNPIVRVRYSGRVDIALRRATRGGEDVRYEAGIGATGASLQITRVNGARVPSVKLGPAYRPDEEHEAVFAAQGSTMTLWIDGRNVTGMVDSSLPSGEINLLIKNDSNGTCRFRQVEYGELPEAVATTGNPASPTTTAYPQPTTWNDTTAELRQRYEGSGDFVADGAWFRTTARSKMYVFAPGQEFRNPIMRVRYSHRLDLALRRTRKGADDLYYSMGIGPSSVFFSVTQPGGGSVPLLPLTKLDPSFRPDEEHEAVFAGQGSTLTLWIDGRKILTTQDSTLASGGLAILMKSDAQYGDSRIKKVEYGELPEASGSNQLVSPPAAEGPWTNLLPLVQLPRDLSEAKPAEGAPPEAPADWRLEGGLLSAGKSGNHAIISPDLVLPESYDLSLRVKASSGKDSSVGVIVPVGSHHMTVHLQLFNFELSGLEIIDGKNVLQGGLTTIRPAALHQNVEQLVEISVRSRDGDASVALKVDGKPVVDWSGRESSINLWSTWNRMKARRLALCANVAGVTFRDVRVRRTEDTVVAPPVPYGEMHTFRGHSYQLVFDKALSWSDAKMKAEKMGGHLATITSKEKDDWIIATFTNFLKEGPKGTSFWLGASRATTKADWQWVTGEPFQFTSWGHGEPNATPEEGFPVGLAYAYAAEIYKGGVGWNDIAPPTNTAWGPKASLGYLVEWDTAQVAPVAKTPAPVEKWTDWLVEQRRNGKLPKGLVEDGVGYKVTSDKFIIPLGPPMRDGAIRITGRRNASGHFLLLLRCLDPGFKNGSTSSFSKAYRLQDTHDGLAMTYRDPSVPYSVRIGEKLTGPDDGSKNQTIELRTVGNVVSVLCDDKLLLNTRDTRLTEGQPCLFADPGAYFEKIEVLDLDGPRLPPLLLSQYTKALTRECNAARPEEKAAYNLELARLKTDPTLPLVDAPGTSDAVAKLRKKARALLGGGR